ncbi:macro domain-containing protein [Sphingomonas sp. MA1305]|uniref:macro domain-containing protein n=1 Tax=Sphingomonas sp. MA1305 TaxID=2479204 RepID=UPI002FCD344A
MPILSDLRTWRFARHFSTKSFASFGVLALFLQTSNVLFPKLTTFQGMPGLVGTLVLSIISGIVLSWPRPITQQYDSPNTRITIAKGDLLDDKSHLVIGTVDTFDTEPPTIISNASLQGQALSKLYGGDLKRLDKELDSSLVGKTVIGNIQKDGKQDQYGIGTVATLKHGPRLLFFLAYCEMDANNNAHSTPDKLWASLSMLWDEISRQGNGGTVAMPVIGGGQARLSSVMPAQDAIRFTLLSFMFASRKSRICDELRIVVRPVDYEKLDRLGLQSFLSSLRSS